MSKFIYSEQICDTKILAERLKFERSEAVRNGLYHITQILFAYNSNRIEGGKLTQAQTKQIFETRTILPDERLRIDDIIETTNHFKAFDFILDLSSAPLSAEFIKKLHYLIKNATTTKMIGEYKKEPNFIGNGVRDVPAASKDVLAKMDELIENYENSARRIDLQNFDDDLASAEFFKIVEFHFKFERIHPFEDGNGRVGRLLMYKECLRRNLIPFIVEFEDRKRYYEGFSDVRRLLDALLICQNGYKEMISRYFAQLTAGI